MTDMVVALRLTGDSASLVGAVQLGEKQLESLAKSAANANQAHSALNKAAGESASIFATLGAAGKSAGELIAKGYESARTSVESFKGALAGIGLVLEAKDIIDTSLAIDRLNGLFTQATGSAHDAREQLELVHKTADSLGQPFLAGAQAYGQLLSQIKDTGTPTQVATNAFLGATEAIAAMRRTGADAQIVYDTMLRAFARGPDSVEQFRLSVGVAIPGFLQKLAEYFHMSEMQFQAWASQGRISAAQIQDAFGPVLDRMFREGALQSVDSATASFNRLGNAWEELKLKIADAGFMDAVTDAVKALTKEIGDPGFIAGVQAFSNLVGDLFKFVVDNSKTLLEVFGAAYGIGKAVSIGGAAATATGTATATTGGLVGGFLAALGLSSYVSSRQVQSDSGGNILFVDPVTGMPVYATDNGQATGAPVGSAAAPQSKPIVVESGGSAKLPGPPAARPALPEIQAVNDNRTAPGTPDATLLIERLQQQSAQLASLLSAGAGDFEQTIKLQADLKAQQAIQQTKTQNPEQVQAIKDYTLSIERATADLKIQNEVLQSVGATQGDYAERIKVINDLYNAGELSVDQYQTATVQAQEKMLASARDWQSGVERAFLKVQDDATNYARGSEKVVTDAFSTMEDAIANFATTGKLNFTNFANSVISDMIRMQVRTSITGPLSQAAGSFFGNLFGGGAPAAANTDIVSQFGAGHTGATIGGATSVTRMAPWSVFIGAARPHTGTPYLANDEVPFIGKKGEVVGWPDQMRQAFGGAGAEIHIHDERGANAPPVQTSQQKGPDGRDVVRVMIRDEVQQGFAQGAFDKSMRGNYRVSRVPAVMRG